MQRLIIRLGLSKERVAEHYRGSARRVLTVASDGRTVEFPATFLRKFITEEGVYGVFEICVDENNKMISMRRLQPGAELDKLA